MAFAECAIRGSSASAKMHGAKEPNRSVGVDIFFHKLVHNWKLYWPPPVLVLISLTRCLCYFLIFWPFATMKISPIISQICQNRSSILPNKK